MNKRFNLLLPDIDCCWVVVFTNIRKALAGNNDVTALLLDELPAVN